MSLSRFTVLHVVERLGGSGGAEASLAQMLPLLEKRKIHNVVLPLDERRWQGHERLLAAGVEVLPAPRTRVVDQMRAVRAAVRSVRPDLVHSCLWRPDLLARVATPRDVPTLVSLVNAQYSREAFARAPSPRRLEMLRQLDGWLARHRTSQLHAITGAVARESARALRVSDSDIVVVPRGRDGSDFRPAEAAERRSVRHDLGLGDQPVVVNVARHEWQKGPLDLLAAFSHIRRQVPGALLVQVGRQGHATAELVARIAELGLIDQVRLLGVRHDIPHILRAGDIFLFSSRWEGLGGSVLEAMASGLPVVAYADPAVSEVLGGTGRVVPVGDAAALGQEAANLLQDPGAISRCGAAARARFESHYQLDAVASAMAALYRDVAARESRL